MDARKIIRLLVSSEDLERNRHLSLVRRTLKKEAKVTKPATLDRHGIRIVTQFDQVGIPYNAETILAEYKRQVANDEAAIARVKQRAPMTIEVRRHIKKLLRGLPKITRETIAALVAFEIERRGGDVSRESVATMVEEMRRQKPKLFAMPSLYEPANSEGI